MATIADLNRVFDLLAASNEGYSQSGSPTDGRWSFLNKSTLSIIPGRALDCSSSCLGGAKAAGFNIDISGLAYTGNAASLFKAAGFSILYWNGMNSWRPGDFVVAPGHHIVYCRDASRWWSAEANEFGAALGGQPGNQNGIESRYRAPYDMSKEGKRTCYIVRPPAEAPVPIVPPLSAVTSTLPAPISPRHCTMSDSVFLHLVQEASGLKPGPDGPKTRAAVGRMQARLGVSRDNDWGPATTEAWLLTLPNINRGDKGLGAAFIQWIVGASVDRDFGSQTEARVKGAQVWAGFTGGDVDGNAGPATKRAITI